jgi:conjugal transfer pilus assembly protein TraV
MKTKKIIFKCLILSFFIFSGYGCGSKIFNPYDKEFSCPETYNGKCTTLDNAYEESLEKEYSKDEITSIMNSQAEKDYIDKKFSRLRNMIDEDKAPLVVPPLTKRALVLPYETGNQMYSVRKIYFFVEDPKFQLPPMEDLRKDF